MKRHSLLSLLVLVSLASCVEPEVLEEDLADQNKVDNPNNSGNPGVPPVIEEPPGVPAEAKNSIASKNYLQINNTYSTVTGVPTDQALVLSEFKAIQMQLPTTSNPEALNGFNQIAQTRLAFAYCNEYIDNKIGDYSPLPDSNAIDLMLNNFIDVDVINNPAHVALKTNIMAIMSDADALVDDGNVTSKRRKLLKMSCAAILSSSYVTML